MLSFKKVVLGILRDKRERKGFYLQGFNVILEKAMATHSSTLAWKIPWAEEPGRLQFMGLGRVGHD